MTIRQPAVSGVFYPGDKASLDNAIATLLSSGKQHWPIPKAIIVPHAGYIYSGSIAASAYATLANKKDSIKKIVILGSAHTLHFQGIAYDPVDYFATPLGEIKQDKVLLKKITPLPFVHALAQAHDKEHSLEVQLPFCQKMFPKAAVLPLVVGEATVEQVAEVLSKVWGTSETLIIISTDLSHYLPYEIAQKMDGKTCRSIDILNHEGIEQQNACGFYPLKGFLHFARQNHIHGRLLDCRNSGDTAGEKEKVVGYASYHFYEKLQFADHCSGELLYLAKEALRLHIEEGLPLIINYKNYNELLQIRAATFVTLKKDGALRGCMGSLHAEEHLASNVVHNTLRAGLSDPRFPKITADELKQLSISISILSPLNPMCFNNETALKAQLTPGIHGLVLNLNKYQAVFLPSVWETLTSKDEFMGHLKVKMGLTADYWSPEFKAYTFTVETIQ
ncbi:MAG: AmmeMemoRadiSam system protein B [Legionella sp.]